MTVLTFRDVSKFSSVNKLMFYSMVCQPDKSSTNKVDLKSKDDVKADSHKSVWCVQTDSRLFIKNHYLLTSIDF